MSKKPFTSFILILESRKKVLKFPFANVNSKEKITGEYKQQNTLFVENFITTMHCEKVESFTTAEACQNSEELSGNVKRTHEFSLFRVQPDFRFAKCSKHLCTINEEMFTSLLN